MRNANLFDKPVYPPSEDKLAPYHADHCISANSVLVLAPHPDDEVFGCGGAMIRHVEAGTPVRVIVVSDGGFGDDANVRSTIVAQRIEESRRAAAAMGTPEPIFWTYRDREVPYGERLVSDIMRALQETGADLLYAPSLCEIHPDHRAIAMSAVEAVRRKGAGIRLAMYEVGVPLRPNVLLDISDVLARKKVAMNCFVSQLAKQNYAEHIEALNRYRAYTLPREVVAAEAYELVAAEDIAHNHLSIFTSEYQRQRELGLPSDGKNDFPLVSVIIRSMDRMSLSDALDSIALQTYPNIEVVLVNALGVQHREMGQWCGSFPLRKVGNNTALHRSRAANEGLDQAKGEYLIFLDDDDWFEPVHIERLVREIRHHPQFKVVYSGVRCVDANKNALPEQFGMPFDAIQLVAGNFIPIHSALFSRTLLESGCRVDETFDVYEDWDFWIQASRLTNFLYVHGCTAVYRIAGTSGFGVRADPAITEKTSLKLFNKWISCLKGQQLLDLMCAVRLNRSKDQHIENITAELSAKSQYIENITAGLNAKNQHIENITAELNAKNQHIENITAELNAKNQHIENITAGLSAKNQLIENITAELSAKAQQIVNITALLGQKDLQLHAQANTIKQFLNSSSWRVTRPLRHVGHLWRKVQDVKSVSQRLLMKDSFPVLLGKALRVFRREGLRGIKARVRQQHYLSTQVAVASVPLLSAGNLGFALEPASIVRDAHGHYAFSTTHHGYTYVPPQCPANVGMRIEALEFKPFFSIVVPVYNTPPTLLEAVLTSVRAQWYPHWQLVLVDDASTDDETQKALAQISHSKIKLLRLKNNLRIAGATNAGLEAANGDFIVFMDHDDEITVDCLYELALCINRDQPDFIYSDEDKLTSLGEYSEPHFKPDWSPDTMMSTMFTGHVSCVRRSLLEKVGELRSQYDGCQDWDFVLRITEQTDRISHIPKVLYHWRIIPASIASHIAAKPYVLEASRRVREDALRRRGLVANIEPLPQMAGYFRVAYQLQGNPLISIIIPTRDNENVLRRCIDSIKQQSRYLHYELIVIDNGSVASTTLDYLQQIAMLEGVTVIRHDAPFNFSELNNIGVRAARGELLLFLNDDTEVLQKDWLERMGGFAQLTHIGAVGAKLLYPGKTQVQHIGILNLEDGPGHAHLLLDCDSPGYYMRNLLEYNWLAVTGACLMVERKKFDVISGFCEELPIAYNDIDLCLRLHDAGYFNIVCQAVRLIHHESVSRGVDHIDPLKSARLKNDKSRLYERNPLYFEYDPFHNPNLHPNNVHFEISA